VCKEVVFFVKTLGLVSVFVVSTSLILLLQLRDPLVSLVKGVKMLTKVVSVK
jgi:hypothetical protein